MASTKHPGPCRSGSVHLCLSLEGSGTRSGLELLPNPLPGLQEAVPPTEGSSGTAEHRPAGGPAPAPEATEIAGECLGGGCCPRPLRAEESGSLAGVQESWPERRRTAAQRPRPPQLFPLTRCQARGRRGLGRSLPSSLSPHPESDCPLPVWGVFPSSPPDLPRAGLLPALA